MNLITFYKIVFFLIAIYYFWLVFKKPKMSEIQIWILHPLIVLFAMSFFGYLSIGAFHEEEVYTAKDISST
jgi:hypothetical protein